MIKAILNQKKKLPFWLFGCKKTSKFEPNEQNSNINIYSLVPKIDRPVAPCSSESQLSANFKHRYFSVNYKIKFFREITSTISRKKLFQPKKKY